MILATDFQTMTLWEHIGHDLFYAVFWFFVGWKVGRRHFRKGIERGWEEAPEVDE